MHAQRPEKSSGWNCRFSVRVYLSVCVYPILSKGIIDEVNFGMQLADEASELFSSSQTWLSPVTDLAICHLLYSFISRYCYSRVGDFVRKCSIKTMWKPLTILDDANSCKGIIMVITNCEHVNSILWSFCIKKSYRSYHEAGTRLHQRTLILYIMFYIKPLLLSNIIIEKPSGESIMGL